MTLQEAIRNASTHAHYTNECGGREKMVIYASAPFTPDSEAKYDLFSPYFNLDMCLFASCDDVSNKIMDAVCDYGDDPDFTRDAERVHSMIEGVVANIIDEVERERGEQNAGSPEQRLLLSHERARKRAECLGLI